MVGAADLLVLSDLDVWDCLRCLLEPPAAAVAQALVISTVFFAVVGRTTPQQLTVGELVVVECDSFPVLSAKSILISCTRLNWSDWFTKIHLVPLHPYCVSA